MSKEKYLEKFSCFDAGFLSIELMQILQLRIDSLAEELQFDVIVIEALKL